MDTTYSILPKNLQEVAGPDPDTYPAAHVCFLVAKPTATQSFLILPTHSKAQANFLPTANIHSSSREASVFSPLTAE